MRRKKRKTRRRRITRRRRTRRRITRRRRTRRRTRRKRGSGNIECPKCKKQFKQNEKALWSTCPHCKQRITKKDIQKKIQKYGFESVQRPGADFHRDTSQQWAPRTRREKWQDAKAGTVTGVVKGISRAHDFLWGRPKRKIKGKKKAPAPTNEDHRSRKQQGTRKRDNFKRKLKRPDKPIIMSSNAPTRPPPPNALTLIRKTPSGRRFGSLIPQEALGRYHNTPEPTPREGLDNWEMIHPPVKHTSHPANNNSNWEEIAVNRNGNNNGNRFI